MFKSASGDNDVISFVVALTQIGGVDYDLSVVRSFAKGGGRDGAAYRWGIVYNFGKLDEMWLTENESGLQVPNGWNVIPGEAVRVSRTPTSITVKIVEAVAEVPPDNSTAWKNTLTVDLNAVSNALPDKGNYATNSPASLSVADLQKFRDPCKWGLGARSQPHCSWGDLFFAGADQPFVNEDLSGYVFNLETGQTWKVTQTAQGATWNLDSTVAIDDFVKNGQAAFDLGSQTLFYKQQGILQPLLSARPQFEEMSANFTVVPSLLGEVVLVNNGVTEIYISENVGEGFYCKFLNHSAVNVTLKPTAPATINGASNDKIIAPGQSFELVGNGLNDGRGVTVLA